MPQTWLVRYRTSCNLGRKTWSFNSMQISFLYHAVVTWHVILGAFLCHGVVTWHVIRGASLYHGVVTWHVILGAVCRSVADRAGVRHPQRAGRHHQGILQPVVPAGEHGRHRRGRHQRHRRRRRAHHGSHGALPAAHPGGPSPDPQVGLGFRV